MINRIVGSLGVSFGFLFVALLSGPLAAGEADYDFVSCAGWANCSTESPNYTGIDRLIHQSILRDTLPHNRFRGTMSHNQPEVHP